MDMLSLDGKRSEYVKVWMTPEEKLLLCSLAEADNDRPLSAYCSIQLRRHILSVLGPDALTQAKE